jgi:hypothetical protein
VPLQCDGHDLGPFLRGAEPEAWRAAAHWEHDFRDVETRYYETALGLPPEACGIAVRLERRFAYAHFAGLPALLFDTERDPGWTRDLAADPAMAPVTRDLAQRLLSFRLHKAERRLTECKLTPQGVLGRYDPP